jgi:glycosyltransferase involved in cell wall biosynthesis
LAKELGIADRVRFLGVVDHGEVARRIEDAEVVVLFSHSEGVPVSLMEAMARGRPVVGPRVTGVAELVEDGVSGLLADPRDPAELADRLAELLADGGRASAMGAAGRARIEADYDMAANARRLAALFAARTA